MAETDAPDHDTSSLDIHPLRQLQSDINYTHPGLGALAAITAIAAKAGKTCLVVGPPGTGKSAVMKWLGEVLPDAYVRGDITMAAMRKYTDELSNASPAILIDDIGACNSDWNRIQTCVALAELVYQHEMVKDTHQIKVEILDFNGSAVMGIQPNVLGEIVKHPAWHSNLADKSMRYYHLFRPTSPNRGDIQAPLDWGVPLEDVLPWDGESPLWDEILAVAIEQWSTARAYEHTHDLLRATAALRTSYTVDDEDLEVLHDLMKPMTVEMEAIHKLGFGSEATLNHNLIYLLAEFASYPAVTYEIIGNDYHMRPRQVQHILEDMHQWYHKVQNNPVVLVPSEELKELLRKAGLR